MMNHFNSMWQRLRSLGRRRAVKQEIDEELRFHIEQRPPRSVRPGKSKFLFCVQPPHKQTAWHDPNDCAHAPGVRVKSAVAEKSSDKVGGLILSDRQHYQTVASMAQRALPQAQIAREKCRLPKRQQEGKNRLVGHAFAAQLVADLPDGNAPASQQLSLTFEDVFVKDIHAAARLSRQFMGVFPERLPRRPHRFGNGFFGDAAAPFFNNALPSHPVGDLLQDIRHENARAAKRGLPMTNLWISDDVAAHHFFSHIASMNTPSESAGQRGMLKGSCL